MAAWQNPDEETWATAVAGSKLPPISLSCVRGSRGIVMPLGNDMPALQSSLKLWVSSLDWGLEPGTPCQEHWAWSSEQKDWVRPEDGSG